MLALALSAALAAEVPTLEEVEARYPYVIRASGSGRSLRLLDAKGREIPTTDALILVGMPEQAEAWKREKTTRNLASIGLWAAAGVAFVGYEVAAVDLGYDGDSLAPLALGLVPPALAGAGFVVRFSVPHKHLGGWTDAGTVADALAARNEGIASSDTPDELAAREARFAEERLYIDYDGRLVDARRHAVRMPVLLKYIDDPETAARYRRVRGMDKGLWIGTTCAGAGLGVVGASLLFVGFVEYLWGGDGNDLAIAGLATGALGAGGMAAGVTGLVVSKRKHDDPAHWYEEKELRSFLDDADADLRQDLQLPPQSSWKLEIHPVLGPGVVGVQGTF